MTRLPVLLNRFSVFPRAMNSEILYSILAEVASRKAQITYRELSRRYYEQTQERYEPHGSWDQPLGELNRRLDGHGLPPLSAVVVLQETMEPGGRFWASSPNIPPQPENDLSRIERYAQLLGQVHAADWPAELP